MTHLALASDKLLNTCFGQKEECGSSNDQYKQED